MTNDRAELEAKCREVLARMRANVQEFFDFLIGVEK
jgi:hypothetical protein